MFAYDLLNFKKSCKISSTFCCILSIDCVMTSPTLGLHIRQRDLPDAFLANSNGCCLCNCNSSFHIKDARCHGAGDAYCGLCVYDTVKPGILFTTVRNIIMPPYSGQLKAAYSINATQYGSQKTLRSSTRIKEFAPSEGSQNPPQDYEFQSRRENDKLRHIIIIMITFIIISLSQDRSTVSSKTNSSQCAIQCFLFQFTASSRLLNIKQLLTSSSSSSSSSSNFYPSFYVYFNNVSQKAVPIQKVTNPLTFQHRNLVFKFQHTLYVKC